MKLVLCLGLLMSFAVAHAENIVCASKEREELYFTQGQILLKGVIADAVSLTDVSMATTGSDVLGFSSENSTGVVKKEFVRFVVGGDAWCSYRLALPEDFTKRTTVIGFLDASCEEGYNYNIRLNCSIQ